MTLETRDPVDAGSAGSKGASSGATRDSRGTPEPLRCMEVWGGNQAIESGVVMPGLDVWVYARPHGDAASGGDVHYVSSCATGRITRALLADVSGHGAAVADVALRLRALMRRFINYHDQKKFMEGLNTGFAALAKEGTFATAVVASYWAPTNYLVLSNAGHPRPLLFRQRARRWQAVDASTAAPGKLANLPFGITHAAYDETSLRLERDDLVLFYSDSMTEVFDPGGVMLEESGLLRLLERISPANPAALIPGLLEAISTYRGGTPADDDVTVLLVRANGLRPRTSLREGLGMTFRMAERLARSLLPGSEPFPWPEMSLANIGGAFLDRANRAIGGEDRRHPPPGPEA